MTREQAQAIPLKSIWENDEEVKELFRNKSEKVTDYLDVMFAHLWLKVAPQTLINNNLLWDESRSDFYYHFSRYFYDNFKWDVKLYSYLHTMGQRAITNRVTSFINISNRFINVSPLSEPDAEDSHEMIWDKLMPPDTSTPLEDYIEKWSPDWTQYQWQQFKRFLRLIYRGGANSLKCRNPKLEKKYVNFFFHLFSRASVCSKLQQAFQSKILSCHAIKKYMNIKGSVNTVFCVRVNCVAAFVFFRDNIKLFKPDEPHLWLKMYVHWQQEKHNGKYDIIHHVRIIIDIFEGRMDRLEKIAPKSLKLSNSNRHQAYNLRVMRKNIKNMGIPTRQIFKNKQTWKDIK